MVDVTIIGAGVSGCAVARELSRYDVSICVLEKGEDVCSGTSKANSAIAHAGFDARPGTLMAKLNVEGNRMMGELSEELSFPFRQIGSLVVCTDPSEKNKLQELLERGLKNGVEGLRIVEREELVRMEPNISDDACAALYAPTAGIICPFMMNIAMAENASVNGAEFRLNTEVIGIRRQEGGYLVETSRGSIETRYIVNAAGVHADEIHNMVSGRKMHIVPRRGEYMLLDKSAGGHVNSTIFMLPGKMGKGVLVTPTVHGNLLIGPTAENIENKEGTNTTRSGLDQVIEKSKKTVKNIPYREVITSFAGLRAFEEGDDFIIEEAADAPQFIDCAGIESPGLTSSPAIGVMIAEMLRDRMNLKKKDNFIAKREGILDPKTLTRAEREELIRRKPAYGNIICRCEMITEGEILDAIHRPVGARSLDGVKRRTRAGMGRCQAGFCSPRVMEILARELPELSIENVTKCGGASKLIVGENKDRW